jgi:hypothetical protein
MFRTIMVGAVLLMLAGCTETGQDSGIASAGGGPGVSVTTAAPPGEVDSVKWAKCLREHGVPADDPAGPDEKPRIPDSVPKDQLDAAAEACRAFNPNWGRPAPPPNPENVERERKFAQCMRAHGVDMADPGAPSDAPVPETTVAGDVVDRAQETCAREVPGVVTPAPREKKK